MSRSNDDKPFYVDVGTSIVAVRCASNHDVVFQYDNNRLPQVIQIAKDTCDRMNKEAENGKPLRNCDMFKDAKTARQAWLDDVDNWDDFGSSKLELHEWLFAPVTKKGE